jgi:hypothetical protein
MQCNVTSCITCADGFTSSSGSVECTALPLNGIKSDHLIAIAVSIGRIIILGIASSPIKYSIMKCTTPVNNKL